MQQKILYGSEEKSRKSRTYQSLDIECSETSIQVKQHSSHDDAEQTDHLGIISISEISNNNNNIKSISMPAATFQVFFSIVGAGCLALPYALRTSGYIAGILLMITAPIICYFTLDLLFISGDYLPNNTPCSYQTLGRYTFGTNFSTSFGSFMCLLYLGALTAYIVAWSALIDSVWDILGGTGSIYKYCAIGISFGITFPFSLLRNLNALSYTSYLSATFVIYLTLILILKYGAICGIEGHYGCHDDVCFWKKEWISRIDNLLSPEKNDDFTEPYLGILTAFPLIIYTNVGHLCVLPIYNRLKDKSLSRMRTVIKSSYSLIFILYFFISTFGVLLFENDVCGNLFLNDYHSHIINGEPIAISVAGIGIAGSCICTSPIYVYNFRRTIGKILWNETPEQLSFIKHFIITIIFISIAVVFGTLTTEITVVFGIMGKTMCFTSFVLPAIYFCKLVPNEKFPIRRILAILQAIIMGIASLASFIWSFIGEPASDDNCANTQNCN